MQHSYFGYKEIKCKWRPVQDLHIINEAVVPLHPVVPNPYTLLSEIPERAKYFSVVDLKDAFYSDHLICLLRNLYAGQEATFRTGHGTTDWFQIGKEYVKAVYCHHGYLTYMQST